jgi:hypothetical protein
MTGLTAVPRWTMNSVPGVGQHEVRIPSDLTAALRRLANDLGVPLSAVLLTARAKCLPRSQASTRCGPATPLVAARRCRS